MKKGFIGPIGDDVPSLIAIILAMGLFFTGFLHAMDVYNQKIVDMEALKGSVEIARAVLGEGILSYDDWSNIDSQAIDHIAKSYSLDKKVFLDDKATCDENAYRFSYLVAVYGSSGDVELHKMVVCTKRVK